MLPDGAHTYAEDWTIFFLNQTPHNTIMPVFTTEQPQSAAPHPDDQTGDKNEPELLYVLNLVRTKRDESVRRCAV